MVTATEELQAQPPSAAKQNSKSASKGKKTAPGKRKKLLPVVVLVVLVAGFAADKFVLSKKPKLKAPVPGTVLHLPTTTINLPNGGLLQVELAVELAKGVGGKGGLPAWDIAQMENDEIAILSLFPEQTLLTSAGKQEAQADLLQAFRRIVGPAPGGQGVMAVYYTDFVMQ